MATVPAFPQSLDIVVVDPFQVIGAHAPISAASCASPAVGQLVGVDRILRPASCRPPQNRARLFHAEISFIAKYVAILRQALRGPPWGSSL